MDKNENKVFTQADIDKAVKKAREQWEQENAELTEKDDISVEREALEKERAELEREKFLNKTAKQLNAAGVPECFAANLAGETEEETKENIDRLIAEWRAAVKEETDRKLNGAAQRHGTAAGADTMRDIIRKNVMLGF